MPGHPLREDILEQLKHLPVEQQYKVLEFSRSLAASKRGGVPGGVPGSKLLKFSGMIDGKDLEAMEGAIEEGCERIDLHEW